MKNTKNKTKRISLGFTLVELLVVVSILGILASLALVSFVGAQKQARDTQRKSDTKQYQNALETFANSSGSFYPSRTTGNGDSASTTLCADLGLTSCTEDPRYSEDVSFIYKYQTDGSGAGIVNATNYVLWAKLENEAVFWVVCSTGVVGEANQAGFSVSGGNCPL